MKRFLPFVLILASFVLASMFNVYPLGFALAQYRPMALMVVLCFWSIYQTNRVGVGVAFIVGLCADLLFDTHLGHQALCAVLMVFFIRVATIYAKRLTLLSSWLLTSIALFLYVGLLWLLQSFGQAGVAMMNIRALLSSLVIFPLVWSLLTIIWQKLEPVTKERFL